MYIYINIAGPLVVLFYMKRARYKYRVSQERLPLKSSALVACSNSVYVLRILGYIRQVKKTFIFQHAALALDFQE